MDEERLVDLAVAGDLGRDLLLRIGCERDERVAGSPAVSGDVLANADARVRRQCPEQRSAAVARGYHPCLLIEFNDDAAEARVGDGLDVRGLLHCQRAGELGVVRQLHDEHCRDAGSLTAQHRDRPRAPRFGQGWHVDAAGKGHRDGVDDVAAAPTAGIGMTHAGVCRCFGDQQSRIGDLGDGMGHLVARQPPAAGEDRRQRDPSTHVIAALRPRGQRRDGVAHRLDCDRSRHPRVDQECLLMTWTGAGGVRFEELDRERGGGEQFVEMPVVRARGRMASDVGAVLDCEQAEDVTRGAAGDGPLDERSADARGDWEKGVVGPGERRLQGRDGFISADRGRDRVAADGPGEPSLPSAECLKVEMINDQAHEDVLSLDFLGHG